MQTNLTTNIMATASGQRANAVLRKCVHCGFCNATCPTYQLLGDELDGPRGRIYLIKRMLEGHAAGRETQTHLDRCLTCRHCETTCPSDVDYGELLSIGRELIEATVKRTPWDRFRRWCLRETLAYPGRFSALLRLAQGLRPALPPRLRRIIPGRQASRGWPSATATGRRMLLLQGCVQPALAPVIDQAAANVLKRLEINTIIDSPACCGALHHHTSAQQEALDFMRKRIDAWWPMVEDGIEAIVSTTSGCGLHVKEYGRLLANDVQYKDKAARISTMTRDIAEVLSREDLAPFRWRGTKAIAYHPPCTLQHGQKLAGVVEEIMSRVGVHLPPTTDDQLCCGSAGSQSLLDPRLAARLGQRKISQLTSTRPAVIITANIGCLQHLAGMTDTPVKHWIEMLIDPDTLSTAN